MNTKWLLNKEKYKEFLGTLPFDAIGKIADTKLHSRKIEILSGRALLNMAIAYEGINTKELELEYMPSGKPFIEGNIHFGISHSDGVTAVAISSFDIGLDVQNITAYNKRAARGIMNEKEIEFIEKSPDKDKAFSRLWSVKEAYAKADGKGIGKWLREKEFLHVLFDEKEIKSEDGNWSFYTTQYNGAYITMCHREQTVPEIIFY